MENKVLPSRHRTKDQKATATSRVSLLPRARVETPKNYHELHSEFPATSIQTNQSGVCAGFSLAVMKRRNQSTHYANRFNSTLLQPRPINFCAAHQADIVFSTADFFVRKSDVLITKTSFILAGHKLGAHTSMLMLHMFPASTNCLKCQPGIREMSNDAHPFHKCCQRKST